MWTGTHRQRHVMRHGGRRSSSRCVTGTRLRTAGPGHSEHIRVDRVISESIMRARQDWPVLFNHRAAQSFSNALPLTPSKLSSNPQKNVGCGV